MVPYRQVGPSGYHIAVVVWGEWHLEAFCNVCLPTLLAPGNVPALARRGRVTFRIYAPSSEQTQIRSTRPFRLLADVADVEFVDIDPPGSDTRDLVLMCNSQRDALARAQLEDAAIALVPPDIALSDGTLSAAAKRIATGKRAVLGQGPKVTEVGWREILTDDSSEGLISLTGTRISELLVTYPHRELEVMMWTPREFAVWPYLLAWNVPGEGLLLRGFQLHPLLLWLRPGAPLPARLEPAAKYVHTESSDGQWIARAFPDLDDIHIAGESSEMAMLSVERAEREHPARQGRAVFNIAMWARDHCSPHHLAFAHRSIAFRTGEPSAAWRRAERQADRVVRRIEWLVRVDCLGADYWHVDKSVPRAKLAALKHGAVERLRASTGRPEPPPRR
jgi:hypothetical protein